MAIVVQRYRTHELWCTSADSSGAISIYIRATLLLAQSDRMRNILELASEVLQLRTPSPEWKEDL